MAPQTDAPADTTFHAVSYVELLPSAKAAGIAAFKRYRDASRRQDGFVRFEFFEQVGRPGHFAIVEAWRDANAFDTRGDVQKDLHSAIESIRISGYDQRPYKTLTVGAAAAAPGNQAIVIVSHVDVAPNPQVPVLLRRLADASRMEPGNVRFDVMQHTMRANHFTVVEIWRDEKAFDAHVAAALTRKYRDELQPLTGSPLDERIYKAID
jgi:quinol monooxygenase YgiN